MTPARRALLVVAVLAVLLAIAGAPASAAPTLSKLTQNNANGAENYVYTAGNTVVINGSVDPADSTHAGRAYRMFFKMPSGATRSSSTCTRDGAKGANVTASYTLTAADPPSDGASWSAVLEQYLDAGCTTLERSASLPLTSPRRRPSPTRG
jgi:hypothetical protein